MYRPESGNSLRATSLFSGIHRGGAYFRALVDGTISIVAKAGKNALIRANQISLEGRLVLPASAVQNLAAGTTVQPNAAVVQITSTGNVTLTATPTIANGVDGQEILLFNADTADTITIQDDGTLANSKLQLTGTTIALGPLDSVRLRYIASLGFWVQVAPHTNVA